MTQFLARSDLHYSLIPPVCSSEGVCRGVNKRQNLEITVALDLKGSQSTAMGECPSRLTLGGLGPCPAGA